MLADDGETTVVDVIRREVERLDPELVEHVACCVERERDRAEYLHDCGIGQWLHMLTEPGFEERRVA